MTFNLVHHLMQKLSFEENTHYSNGKTLERPNRKQLSRFSNADFSHQYREKPKISIFMDSLQGYGADKILLKVANGLTQEDIDVDFILAKTEERIYQEVNTPVKIIDLESSRLNPIKNIFYLTQYLRKHQPEILFSSIHFNNIVCALAILLSGASTKLVVRQANTLRKQFRDYPLLISCVLYCLTYLTYKRADLVICQCQSMVSDLTKFMRVNPKKIKILYNPTVTGDIFEKAKQNPSHKWLHLNKTVPVVLAIGRLKPQKDFVTLLKAFAHLKHHIQKDVKLVILGNGPQRQELEALAVQLNIQDDVDLLGFQANPYAFISMADVFVSSSRYEGLPNVLIEALALGKRIVATHCEGGSVEILKYGRYGNLVPVGDANYLANAIAYALEQPADCSIDRTAIQDFEQKAQVRKYVSVFLSLMPSDQGFIHSSEAAYRSQDFEEVSRV